ncbi:DUF2752 domain-containing protein [uncultured Pseudokineococcus sp.]|uniref:DUF2752 domain-containing protein n=1 Tax=uncultured Pseudokineococcus sp. TaxID=1642928 RepID=UPI002632B1DB|nr:DUF2752 domain-containing protein [uncultured Pseudokineococcus sp.]
MLALTGLPCPFCGGLRAVSDVLAGQPLAALGSNALAVVLVGAAVAVWGVWLVAALRRRPLRLVDAVTDRGALALAVVLAAFTVVRWLPGASAVLGP